MDKGHLLGIATVDLESMKEDCRAEVVVHVSINNFSWNFLFT